MKSEMKFGTATTVILTNYLVVSFEKTTFTAPNKGFFFITR